MGRGREGGRQRGENESDLSLLDSAPSLWLIDEGAPGIQTTAQARV